MRVSMRYVQLRLYLIYNHRPYKLNLSFNCSFKLLLINFSPSISVYVYVYITIV